MMGLIVAPWKFDVHKTNMLVLRVAWGNVKARSLQSGGKHEIWHKESCWYRK